MISESIKAALIEFDLNKDASVEDVWDEYLDKTSDTKFQQWVLTDEQLRNEFIRYHKAFVTLLKHYSESGSEGDFYPQDEEELFQFFMNQGIYYFITQNYIKAGEKFQAAYRIDKTQPLLLIYLGVLLLKRRDFYAAEKYFKDAIEIDKEFDDAWFYLGENYFKAGELKKALDMYEQAKRLNPDRTRVGERVKEIRQKMAKPAPPPSTKKPSFFQRLLNLFRK
jgi:tetratricopeptide (TPR) repeat protein